jgi:hypothetical protein
LFCFFFIFFLPSPLTMPPLSFSPFLLPHSVLPRLSFPFLLLFNSFFSFLFHSLILHLKQFSSFLEKIMRLRHRNKSSGLWTVKIKKNTKFAFAASVFGLKSRVLDPLLAMLVLVLFTFLKTALLSRNSLVAVPIPLPSTPRHRDTRDKINLLPPLMYRLQSYLKVALFSWHTLSVGWRVWGGSDCRLDARSL